MNKIILIELKLKTFTEQDVLDYCSINNININNIIKLYLYNNELTDISGIKLFKNVNKLDLAYNKLTDISVLKDLTGLKELYLWNNQITDISVLKDLNKLEELYISNNELTDISVLKYLKNINILNIVNLQLESDQIQYIKFLKKLNTLWCKNGFKNMSVIKQLNNRIIKNE